MNRLSALVQSFQSHPASVGQTYLQHLRFSASIALKLQKAAITAVLHALIPCAFQTDTSQSIEDLHQCMCHQLNRASKK